MIYKPKILKIKFPKVLYAEFMNNTYAYKDYLNLPLNKKKLIINNNLLIKKWVHKLKKKIKNENPAVIIDLKECVHPEPDKISNFKLFNVFFSIFFGKLLFQNDKNDKVISVFDRDKRKSMKQGARYHQTHEGGSIHTDNVNIPDYWDFLFFSCISQSSRGGHSLIVDGKIVYKILQKKFNNDLQLLMKKFWFEKRGLSNALFKSPIIHVNKKEVKFRYLRPYLESAQLKSKETLSEEKIKALNTLDKILQNPKLQKKFKLKEYQLLITQDFRILHGRTAFYDHPKAVELDKFNPKVGHKLKRTMERMWIKEN